MALFGGALSNMVKSRNGAIHTAIPVTSCRHLFAIATSSYRTQHRKFGTGVDGHDIPHTEHVRFCNGTNGVGTLQLNRPDELDALSETMAEEIVMLSKFFNKMDPMQLRCLILTGSTDKSFSVGRDLKISHLHETSERRLKYLKLGGQAVQAIHDLEVPTIACVEGQCTGWGLELALACDLRVAAPTANMSFPETKLGIFPGAGGIILLQEALGYSGLVKELVFTGREVSGTESATIGLVNHCSDSPLQKAYEMAAGICLNGPLGVRAAKRVIHRAFDLDEEAALEYSRCAVPPPPPPPGPIGQAATQCICRL